MMPTFAELALGGIGAAGAGAICAVGANFTRDRNLRVILRVAGGALLLVGLWLLWASYSPAWGN